MTFMPFLTNIGSFSPAETATGGFPGEKNAGQGGDSFLEKLLGAIAVPGQDIHKAEQKTEGGPRQGTEIISGLLPRELAEQFSASSLSPEEGRSLMQFLIDLLSGNPIRENMDIPGGDSSENLVQQMVDDLKTVFDRPEQQEKIAGTVLNLLAGNFLSDSGAPGEKTQKTALPETSSHLLPLPENEKRANTTETPDKPDVHTQKEGLSGWPAISMKEELARLLHGEFSHLLNQGEGSDVNTGRENSSQAISTGMFPANSKATGKQAGAIDFQPEKKELSGKKRNNNILEALSRQLAEESASLMPEAGHEQLVPQQPLVFPTSAKGKNSVSVLQGLQPEGPVTQSSGNMTRKTVPGASGDNSYQDVNTTGKNAEKHTVNTESAESDVYFKSTDMPALSEDSALPGMKNSEPGGLRAEAVSEKGMAKTLVTGHTDRDIAPDNPSGQRTGLEKFEHLEQLDVVAEMAAPEKIGSNASAAEIKPDTQTMSIPAEDGKARSSTLERSGDAGPARDMVTLSDSRHGGGDSVSDMPDDSIMVSSVTPGKTAASMDNNLHGQHSDKGPKEVGLADTRVMDGAERTAQNRSAETPAAIRGNNTPPADTHMKRDEEAVRVAGQLEQGITEAVRMNRSRAVLHLNPPELGSVKIRISVYGGNEIKAVFVTDNPDTRQLIHAGLDTLRGHLADSGYALGSANVDVGQQETFAGRHGQQGFGAFHGRETVMANDEEHIPDNPALGMDSVQESGVYRVM